MTAKRTPVMDRLMAKVSEDRNGCWIFAGAKGNGYGVIGLGGRAEGIEYVHRLTYQHFVVEIPSDLHVDHLCRVRECCNPWHLELVSQAENNRRAWQARGHASHCRRGHEYTPDNTVTTPKQRFCRACRRVRYLENRNAA